MTENRDNHDNRPAEPSTYQILAAEIEQRDATVTALLERIDVPEHGDGFWDGLTRQMAEAAPAPTPLRRFDARSSRVLLLAAAVALTLLAGAAVVATWSTADRSQAIDTGPDRSETTLPEPAPPVDADPPQVAEDYEESTASGSDSDWFFGDRMVWTGTEFASTGQHTDGSDHWTSTDGVEWDRHDGSHPQTWNAWDCPDGFTCDVAPDADPIPFHYSAPHHRVLARSGDVILLQAWTQYSIDREDTDDVAPQADLHPDLLALAAASDPCFQEVLQQSQAGSVGSGEDGAYISGWGGGGTASPVYSMSCSYGAGQAAQYHLDLRDHLTDDQIERAFSSGIDTELWVERRGEPARRVDQPPMAASWIDGVVDGELWHTLAVGSSGDRFWAIDDGTLVSSVDGSSWSTAPLPEVGLEPTEVVAGPGGHVAVRLTEDSRVWSSAAAVTVSHDGGDTWTKPTDLPTDVYRLAVGPSGVATISEPDLAPGAATPPRTLSLLDGGDTVFTVRLSTGSCCENITVGEDRVLVLGNEQLDIYASDGSLIHRTRWSNDESANRWVWIAGLLFLGAAAAAGITIRRRSASTLA